jgi:hypothetical protein
VRTKNTSPATPVVPIAAAALLAAVALLVTGAGLRFARDLRTTWPREADTLVLPSARVLRIVAFGHTEMASDLVAARANVYFGSQFAAGGEQKWLAHTLNTAVDLDPYFHRLYLRGAAMLVYNGKTFTVASLQAANSLLDRGTRAFPGDWELPFQRGFNLLFELPKVVGEDDPRVPDWRQQGVESLRQATLLDGAPPWLPILAARMLTKQGEDELAIRHLERTFEVTNSPETRAEIARKLGELRGRHFAEELAAGAAALKDAVAQRYPYAPEAFSVIMGPRVAPGVDLNALLHRDIGAVNDSITTPPTGTSP